MSITVRVFALLALSTALAVIGSQHIVLSYDLGDFLPAPSDAGQQYLVESLGQDPGAQLIFVQLPESSKRAEVSGRLRQIEGVHLLEDDIASGDIQDIPQPLWRHRLLLCDAPDSEAEWQDVLNARLQDLLIADESLMRLIGADPQLCLAQVMEALASVSDIPEDIVALRAEVDAFNPGEQATLVAQLRAAIPSDAELLGSAVYAADLQATVRSESTFYSILASLALATLIYLRFRSAAITIGIGAPLCVAASAGFFAIALLFDAVHGITLAFGFTLLGIAIDYPLHAFAHSPSERIWPTLGLGITSTLLAYGAFAFSGTSGIAQLGVLTVSGLLGAALATWVLRPEPVLVDLSRRSAAPVRHLPWMAASAVAGVLLWCAPPDSNDLSRLTPLPEETMAKDRQLRSATSALDLRYVMLIEEHTLEQSLQATEQLESRLEALQTLGILEGYQSATTILPSAATQRERLAALAENQLNPAIARDNFAADAFREYHKAVDEMQQSGELLTLDTLATSTLAPLTNRLLGKTEGGWRSVVFLRGVSDIEALRQAVPDSLIDLKAASETLVRQYRADLTATLAIAGGLIALLLLLATRNFVRWCWCTGTLIAAVTLAAAISSFMSDGLSLFALMALVLVAGLGLDYTLFMSRRLDNETAASETNDAVSLCALSSALVFGMLALSSVPVLRQIGGTVLIGVLCVYLLSRYGRAHTRIEIAQP